MSAPPPKSRSASMVNHTDGSTGQSIAARPDINRSPVKGFAPPTPDVRLDLQLQSLHPWGARHRKPTAENAENAENAEIRSAMKGGTSEGVSKPQSQTEEGKGLENG